MGNFNTVPANAPAGVVALSETFWNAEVRDPLTAIQAGWVSWTPTLTNVTLGNGTVTGWYNRVGKTGEVHITFTFGSTSSITGGVTCNLPTGWSVATRYAAGISTLGGVVNAMDVSASANFHTVPVITSVGSSLIQFAPHGQNRVTAAVPMTWATGDVLDGSFRVELA